MTEGAAPGAGTVSARLAPPRAGDATTVAWWSRSAEEARRWCSVAEHPFPAERVRGWWAGNDVQPWLLAEGPEAVPVGYGELWVDGEEDEVELARLIVDPERRRAGLGRQLVASLVGAAEATGRAACVLRVVPDNSAALGLYRTAGFAEVEPDRAFAWNQGQPAAYVWFEWPGFGVASPV